MVGAQHIDGEPMQFGDAIAADVSAPRGAAAAGERAGDIIGVIDDDPLIGDTLLANLDEAGFKAMLFDSGRSALAYLADGGQLSGILLDWAMPEMDGPEVLRRLRAVGHSIPVIFLTGYSQPVFEEAALAGGAVDFVDKARSFAIIMQRLKLALAGAKARRSGAAPQQPGLHIDESSFRVYWRGAQVDLSLSEVKIVQLLVTHAGKDVSYRAIYDRLRGAGFQAGAGEDGYRTNVRAMVKRIRQSFRGADASFDRIKNYPGFGYRWSDGPP